MRRFLTMSVLPALVALAVLAGGIWLGGHPDSLPRPIRDALVSDDKAQLFDEALDDVADNYYRKVDKDTLTDDAIDGMVRRVRPVTSSMANLLDLWCRGRRGKS